MEARRVEDFILSDSPALLKTLRFYVLRAGLATGAEIGQMADELLSETVIAALATCERLKPEIDTRAWLLGIAANLIRRRQAEVARRERREPLIRDLYTGTQATLSDAELFDMLPVTVEESLEELEMNERVNQMLAHVSPDDANVLRMAILYDMDANALGQALAISPATARVRLHRALKRLRNALQSRRVSP